MSRLRIVAEPAYRTRHANPYNAALYDAVQALGHEVRDLSYIGLPVRGPDIVHLHWPELSFLSGHRRWRVIARLVLFFAGLRIARLRGARLVWTAHNLQAHEQRSTPRLRAWYRRLLVRNIDAVICLSSSGAASLREEWPELASRPVAVIPHGHYRGLYDLDTPRDAARSSFGLADDEVFVTSIGQIRRYKNIPALLAAATAVRDPRLRIGIAGRPADAALHAEIESGAATLNAPRLALDFLSDADLALWTAASDLVVLPYARVDNSGSAVLALSAGRPVVAPRMGALQDLMAQVGPDWVMLYDGGFDAGVLRRGIEWWERTPRPVLPDLSLLEWDRIAGDTVRFYDEVLGTSRRR